MLLAQDDSSPPAIIDNNLLKNWAESREPIRPELTAEGERSESNRLGD